jgi:hypothetical protein
MNQLVNNKFDNRKNVLIQHVCVFWFKDTVTEKEIEELKHDFNALRSIPGVMDVQFGKPTAIDREGTDTSFDFSFIVTFGSFEDILVYQPLPLHQKAIEINYGDNRP